ncbi:5687_t:CDS:1, partial [Dentiscutata heterogama]
FNNRMVFWGFVIKAVIKVVIAITAGTILGPSAIPVSTAVWGGSEIIRQNCGNEDVNRVIGFIGDFGRDTITCEVIGLAVQGALTVIALSKAISIATPGQKRSKESSHKSTKKYSPGAKV